MTQGYGPQNGQDGQWGQQSQNGQQGQWGAEGQPGQQPAQQPQWGQPSPAPAAPQWGQQPGSQQQQWGQPSPAQGEQPQWGQPSPAAAPQQQGSWSQVPQASPAASYPGASGYTGLPAAQGDASKAPLAKKLGIALIALSVLAILSRFATPIFMFMMAANGGPSQMDEVSVGMGLSSIGTLLAWIANLLFSLGLLVIAIIAAIQFRGRARTGAIIVGATVIVSVILYWIVSFIGGFLGAAIAGNSYDLGTIYTVGGIAEILRILVVAAALLVGSYMVYAWGRKNAS